MICRETRASGWLRQLLRARPMTAAGFIRVYRRTTSELQTPGAASGTVQVDAGGWWS